MITFELGRSALLTIFVAAVIGLGIACQPQANVPNKPPVIPSPSVSPSVSPTVSPTGSPSATGADKLVGRWSGPEGTYISITEKPGMPDDAKNASKKYSVEIKNLDKAETFDGTAKADAIEFTRKGKVETVKAATGLETGMKGFEKETTCVVVTKGSEGFCKK